MRRIHTLHMLPLLLVACTTAPPLFESAQGKDVAQVAFSSKMEGVPALHMAVECKKYLISNAMVEDREPKEPAEQIQTIPAGKKVTFYYQNMEIGKPQKEPVATQSEGTHRIEIKERPTGEVCDTTVTFIPAKNKQYELFFGTTRENACHIFVYEVLNSLKAEKKKFGKVSLAVKDPC